TSSNASSRSSGHAANSMPRESERARRDHAVRSNERNSEAPPARGGPCDRERSRDPLDFDDPPKPNEGGSVALLVLIFVFILGMANGGSLRRAMPRPSNSTQPRGWRRCGPAQERTTTATSWA